MEDYLQTGQIETVLAGGENYEGDRPLRYEWVKQIYDQCIRYDVEFIFGQTGNYFAKDGKIYHIRDNRTQIEQALASGLQNRRPETKKEDTSMTREGIYEFIARQKTSLISSVDENGYPTRRHNHEKTIINIITCIKCDFCGEHCIIFYGRAYNR